LLPRASSNGRCSLRCCAAFRARWAPARRVPHRSPAANTLAPAVARLHGRPSHPAAAPVALTPVVLARRAAEPARIAPAHYVSH
jgi:hypothetical protein